MSEFLTGAPMQLVQKSDVPTDFILEGVERLEDAPADDVATFIHHVVRVVARAAGHAVGREVKSTGRHESIVEAAARVRIQSIRSGSVAVSILPAPHHDFPLGDNLGLDAETVSALALGIAVRAAAEEAETYPDVARAWSDLGHEVGIGARYERVTINPPQGSSVVIDKNNLKRLTEIADARLRSQSTDTVRGVLYEANFETSTAKLRTSRHELVEVRFAVDVADQIKDALRNPTTLVGEVTFDSKENRAISVEVRQVERPYQLGLEDFWTTPTVADLLTTQGVEPIMDPSVLIVPEISDDDWERLRESLAIDA